MATESDVSFDPYHKWLGISKAQRPPTHYQLLGLSQGESDVEVIDEAAIRQSTHLRAYQVGPHSDVCTRILNEIARARQVLANPRKRQEYDRKLAFGRSAERRRIADRIRVRGPRRNDDDATRRPKRVSR